MSTPTPQFGNDPNVPQPHFEQHAQPEALASRDVHSDVDASADTGPQNDAAAQAGSDTSYSGGADSGAQAYNAEQPYASGQTYAGGQPYEGEQAYAGSSAYGQQQSYGYQQGYTGGYTQQNYDYAAQQPYGAFGTAPKSKIAAALLGIFLGTFGIHNFYLGFTTKAVIQLLLTVLSFGTLSWISWIWGLIEGILILTAQPGTQWHRDARGVELTD